MKNEITEYYRKLDEVVIGKRKPVFLMERQSDKKVALVKPSYVATYGLQDSTGGLYVAASKTKETRLERMGWKTREEAL